MPDAIGRLSTEPQARATLSRPDRVCPLLHLAELDEEEVPSCPAR